MNIPDAIGGTSIVRLRKFVLPNCQTLMRVADLATGPVREPSDPTCAAPVENDWSDSSRLIAAGAAFRYAIPSFLALFSVKADFNPFSRTARMATRVGVETWKRLP